MKKSGWDVRWKHQYKNIACTCRNRVREAGGQLKLELRRENEKIKIKGVCISRKGKVRRVQQKKEVQYHITHLDTHKSQVSDGIHVGCLRSWPVPLQAHPLLSLKSDNNWGMFLLTGKMQRQRTSSRRPRTLNSISGKAMEQILF